MEGEFLPFGKKEKETENKLKDRSFFDDINSKVEDYYSLDDEERIKIIKW